MKTAAKKHAMDLTQGPILKQLVLFTLPIFLTQLLQELYNTADRMVVGQFSGDLALAAVGSVGYPVNLLLAVMTGLATGANVIIANFRGARNEKAAREANHTSIMLSIVGGLALMVLGLLFSEGILRWMNTPADILASSALYMRIIFCGAPFSMIYNFGASILRAYGDTRHSLLILGISGIANVLLNLLFVIVFHMSVAGVALATIISQAISAVWILLVLTDKEGDVRLRLKEVRFYKNATGPILRAGLPCSVNNVLFNASGVFLQASINSLGPMVVAGSAGAGSLTNLSATLIGALFNGCISFAGQNYGARKYKRLDQLFVSALLLGVSVSATMALLFTLFSTPLLSLFISEPDSISAGTVDLLCISWGYLFQTVAYAGLGICRGMRKSTAPTVISVICLCVVRLAWVFLVFPMRPTIYVLFMCYPLSFFCNAVGHTTYYLICRSKLKNAT